MGPQVTAIPYTYHIRIGVKPSVFMIVARIGKPRRPDTYTTMA